MTNKIRTFDSGATRDTIEGKLSYVRILSPIALRRYVKYMNFHAKQSDGTMRKPDNWKSGFPVETYLDSLGRHLVAVWLLQQGFTETDNHGPVTLEDSLCGIIFNSMGWLHETLKKKTTTEFVCPEKVFVRSSTKFGRKHCWVVDVRNNMNDYVYPDGIIRSEYIDYATKEDAEAALVAYLEKEGS